MSESAVRTLSIRSPEAMRRLGRRLGELLQPGDFVGLVGELGAGKTLMVRGVSEGAGVDASEVASPSFAIVYPYRGRIPLYHADLYRVGDYDELYATGFFDLVGGDGAVLCEWIDKIPDALPPQHLLIRIEVSSPKTRRVLLEPHGARFEQLADALVQPPQA